jgi:hypothetical protein
MKSRITKFATFLLLAGFLVVVAFLDINAIKSGKQAVLSDASKVVHQLTVNTQPPASSTTNPTVPSQSSGGTGTGTASDTTPTSDTTDNWAGYVSTGGTYSAVSGSWTAPSVTADSDTSGADASWIGIGGVTSDDLIQIGTQDIVNNGQVTTAAFYEELPYTSETITDIDVNPGDAVTASITETSTGVWSINIEDKTNGESYSNTVAYDSSLSSAEWIEEAPSDETSVLPLDDFGSITFSDTSAVENGKTVNIADSTNPSSVVMDNSEGQALTNTSSLTASGTSFTVDRTSASSGSEQDYSPVPEGWTHHERGFESGAGYSLF